MTSAEINAALKRIISEAGAVAADPTAREARTLAAAIAMLAVVVGDQERRLIAMSSCPQKPGAEPHVWIGEGAAMVCGYCGCRR